MENPIKESLFCDQHRGQGGGAKYADVETFNGKNPTLP